MARLKAGAKQRKYLTRFPWQVDLGLSIACAASAYFHAEIAVGIKTLLQDIKPAVTEGTQLIDSIIFGTVEPLLSLLLLVGGTFATTLLGLTGLLKLSRNMFPANKEARMMQSAHQAASNSRTLQDLEWREFEYLVGQVFKDQGYQVQMGQGSQDKGIDITLVNRRNETLLVQCKHWKSTNVGATMVREMAGVVQLHGAQRGAIVCSGRFTQGARQEAEQLGITLVDGRQVLNQLGAQ